MKKKIIFPTAILLALLTSAALATGEGEREEWSDTWLKAKLVTTYTLNRHLNPFKLEVDVKNGVAHLGGTVDSSVERDLAVEIAKGVEGIREVKSDIRIEPRAVPEEGEEPEFMRVVEDATVTARVKSKLLWNRNTNGLDIDVDTDHGVVTLKGKVESDAVRQLALHLAKNTPGVRAVDDELTVAGEGKVARKIRETEQTLSDSWVTAKVKTQLLLSTEADGAHIEVSTENRVVTLRGTVLSEAQKEKVEGLVQDVVGVKEVSSQLKVEKG